MKVAGPLRDALQAWQLIGPTRQPYDEVADRWGNPGFTKYVKLLEHQANRALETAPQVRQGIQLSVLPKRWRLGSEWAFSCLLAVKAILAFASIQIMPLIDCEVCQLARIACCLGF
jgi:hypothetical protein